MSGPESYFVSSAVALLILPDKRSDLLLLMPSISDLSLIAQVILYYLRFMLEGSVLQLCFKVLQ